MPKLGRNCCILLYNWSGFTQTMEQDSEVGKATAAGMITPAKEGLSTLDTDKDGQLDTHTLKQMSGDKDLCHFC